MSDARLDELDREEFWDIARRLNPDLSREQYDRDWEEFQALKVARKRH